MPMPMSSKTYTRPVSTASFDSGIALSSRSSSRANSRSRSHTLSHGHYSPLKPLNFNYDRGHFQQIPPQLPHPVFKPQPLYPMRPKNCFPVLNGMSNCRHLMQPWQNSSRSFNSGICYERKCHISSMKAQYLSRSKTWHWNRFPDTEALHFQRPTLRRQHTDRQRQNSRKNKIHERYPTHHMYTQVHPFIMYSMDPRVIQTHPTAFHHRRRPLTSYHTHSQPPYQQLLSPHSKSKHQHPAPINRSKPQSKQNSVDLLATIKPNSEIQSKESTVSTLTKAISSVESHRESEHRNNKIMAELECIDKLDVEYNKVDHYDEVDTFIKRFMRLQQRFNMSDAEAGEYCLMKLGSQVLKYLFREADCISESFQKLSKWLMDRYGGLKHPDYYLNVLKKQSMTAGMSVLDWYDFVRDNVEKYTRQLTVDENYTKTMCFIFFKLGLSGMINFKIQRYFPDFKISTLSELLDMALKTEKYISHFGTKYKEYDLKYE